MTVARYDESMHIMLSSYEGCYAMTDALYSIGSCLTSMQSAGQAMIRSDRITSHLMRSIEREQRVLQ